MKLYFENYQDDDYYECLDWDLYDWKEYLAYVLDVDEHKLLDDLYAKNCKKYLHLFPTHGIDERTEKLFASKFCK